MSGIRYKLPLAVAQRIRFKHCSESFETACWIWTGSFNADGIPRWEGSTASSKIYKLIVGNPVGVLRNMCNIRECVNPHHKMDSGKPCPSCGRKYGKR